MADLHREYPWYGWDRNAGYPTRQHRQGIAEHGPSPFHRMTFNLLGSRQLEIQFG
jgi:ribonuclease HII